MNKKTIITALFALVALAGQAQENNYTIKGKVDNADIKVVYLDQKGKGYEGILDSAIVTNGEFTFAGKVSEPVPAAIINKNRYVLYMFILEPGNITFKSRFHAVGGAFNDSLTHLSEYPKSLVDITDDEARRKHFEQYTEAMYLRHKNDALGLKILGQYW